MSKTAGTIVNARRFLAPAFLVLLLPACAHRLLFLLPSQPEAKFDISSSEMEWVEAQLDKAPAEATEACAYWRSAQTNLVEKPSRYGSFRNNWEMTEGQPKLSSSRVYNGRALIGDLLTYEVGLWCLRADLVVLEQKCHQGSAQDCVALAQKYDEGKDVPKDPARSVSLRGRACDAGDFESCRSLARFYLDGYAGLPRDAQRAQRYWEAACNAGIGRSCSDLAQVFWRGSDGFSKDVPRAVKLFNQGCDSNDPDACTFAARIYAEGGEGVPKDLRLAGVLLLRACDRSNGSGCYELAALGERLGYNWEQRVEFIRKACGASQIYCDMLPGGECRFIDRLLPIGSCATSTSACSRLFGRCCGDVLGECCRIQSHKYISPLPMEIQFTDARGNVIDPHHSANSSVGTCMAQ